MPSKVSLRKPEGKGYTAGSAAVIHVFALKTSMSPGSKGSGGALLADGSDSIPYFGNLQIEKQEEGML